MSNNQSQPTASEMICQSLRSVASISGRLANFIDENPHEADNLVGGIKAVSEQMDELASAVADARDAGGDLKATVQQIESTAGWVLDRYSAGTPSVTVNNAFGRVVGSFADL